MNRRYLLAALCLSALALQNTADAQLFRRLRSPETPETPDPKDDKNLNPAHNALRTQAEDRYQSGDFSGCEQLCNTILTQNPNDHVALYLRSSARVEQGQVMANGDLLRTGIEDARQAIRVGGSSQVNYYLPYMYGMTGLSGLEGKPEHAAVSVQVADSVLARATVAGQERANVFYQKALALVAQRKLDEAIAAYQAAIQVFPNHLGARLGLGDTYVMAGKAPEAEQAFTAAAAAFPTNALVYNNRGMLYQQTNRPNEAIADFTRAMELDKDLTVARINRGFALMNAGNLTAAETDFTASITEDPENPLPYGLRASCRLLRGDAAGAQADYQQVIQMDEKNPVAWGDVGFVKYFGKDYPGAMDAFNQAVTINRNLRYLQPWQFLCMMRSGQAEQAAKSFEAVLNKPADQQDWIDKLMLFLSGRITEDQLRAAISPDANLKVAQGCEAAFFAAEKRAIAGDTAGANALYQQAVSSNIRQLSAFRGALYALGKFVPAQ